VRGGASHDTQNPEKGIAGLTDVYSVCTDCTEDVNSGWHAEKYREAGWNWADVTMESKGRGAKDYIAYLHKDKKSDFGVSFPDFPGCITAGRTLEEARQLAEEAAYCRDAGR